MKNFFTEENSIPTISLCMIVKNEEDNLALALDSVKDYVDEILITDTGSTDKTVEIAKQYTDQISYFEWCDDFAAARNYSIKDAKMDWILILDADEVIPKDSLLKFKTTIESLDDNVAGLLWQNYDIKPGQAKEVLSDELSFPGEYTHDHLRSFRNHCGYYFKYSLHSKLVIEDNRQIIKTQLIVNHFGYHQIKERNKRNLNCAIKEHQEHPDDLFALFNLAREYKSNGLNDLMIEAYNILIKVYLQQEQKNPYFTLETLFDFFIGSIVSLPEQAELAEKLAYSWISRIDSQPDVQPYFYLGLIYLNHNKVQDAKKMLRIVADNIDKYWQAYGYLKKTDAKTVSEQKLTEIEKLNKLSGA